MAAQLYEHRTAKADLTWRDSLLGLRQKADRLRRRGTDTGRSPRTARLAELLLGRWEFLSEIGELGWPPDWSAPSKSRLWLFHLHYFDDLPTLSLELNQPIQPVFDLLEDWVRANPIHGGGATPDAWHPYTVSLRMVNWILALSSIADARDVPEGIRRSLEQHAVFLERNLEVDNGGNHLLKNLKAMTFAGCFWSGLRANHWRDQFSGWFAEELDRQLTADGGHYERSPMYHCQVLGDAIEVASVLVLSGASIKGLLPLLNRMDAFLELVTHPDGQIALFNDSAFGMVPTPIELHCAVDRLNEGGSDRSLSPNRLDLLLPPPPPATAQRSARVREGVDSTQAALASGYVVIPEAMKQRYLIADVGPVCPDSLPAHAHADLLSFELSLDGRRIIVDSGVVEYAAGPQRQYYRSTRAHNTVMVDSCEQSDCWASFRVGRRAAPAGVSLRRTPGALLLQAEHTGFTHLSGNVRHRRLFAWAVDDFWTVADTLLGAGKHTWRSYCHFHPDVSVIAQHESSIRVAREKVILDVAWFGFESGACVRGERDELQGWYAERFGQPTPSTVLVLDGCGDLPANFGYVLVPRPDIDAPQATASNTSSHGIEIRLGDSTYRPAL